MKITKFHNSIIVINIQPIYGAQFAICIPILNVNLHRIVQVPVGGTPTQLPSKAQQLHHLRSNNASSKGRTGTGTNEAILIFQSRAAGSAACGLTEGRVQHEKIVHLEVKTCWKI